MITNARKFTGYAAGLPVVQALERTQLAHGLHVLWGPNGSGKTTALQIIAAHTLCANGGWSRLRDPLEFAPYAKRQTCMSSVARMAPGECGVTLQWDRMPVFFANSLDTSDFQTLDSGAEHSQDGMTDFFTAAKLKFERPSSGQLRALKLEQTLQQLRSAPDFKNVRLRPGLNDTWKAVYRDQIKFMESRPDNGRVTVLLDEPDRHLDLVAAERLWSVVIPHIAKHAQVLVATHHPFALAREEAKWICAEAGEQSKALSLYRRVLTRT